ncbi:meiosis inhibitor protein 1 isoform X2 [Erpetoichthys calabaricus]|nr:meiosis inhibitor protein 1 isoform X2 [Erpetoichthys calabaricus]
MLLKRCIDLPIVKQEHQITLPSSSFCSSRKRLRGQEFLLMSIKAFHRACRLAVECTGDPSVQENAFTAPNCRTDDTLEKYTYFLLDTCDIMCIPIITKHCEGIVSPAVMQIFFSVLNSQYVLVPRMMDQLSTKLASSSFFRLTLQLKAKFCTGDRNVCLNESCSEFLWRLCMSLLSKMKVAVWFEDDLGQVQAILQRSIPYLNCYLSDCATLLCEDPGACSAGNGDLRSIQYSLLILLYLAHLNHDMLIQEDAIFPAVCNLLCSINEHGEKIFTFALKAALYLLSVSQDKSTNMDWVSLSNICKLLGSVPNFLSVYTHHPQVLRFLFHYSALTEKFGLHVLEQWLDWPTENTGGYGCSYSLPLLESESEQMELHQPVISLVETNSTALLVLMEIICSGEARLSHRALLLLSSYLQNNQSHDLSVFEIMRPKLLQFLQQFIIENETEALEGNEHLPLILQLLCMVQLSSLSVKEEDDTDFKLLYHVCNLTGKVKKSETKILQPAFNYLYCSLHLAIPCYKNKVVSVLLSNISLLNLIEALSEHCYLAHTLQETPEVSLLCSTWLLLRSLLQSLLSNIPEIQQVITLDLDKLLALITFRRKTSSLLLACSLHLLQTLLDLELSSPLIKIKQSAQTQSFLQDSDASLYPLCSSRTLHLLVALQNLFLQKEEIVQYASLSCLESLLGYLQRKSNKTCTMIIIILFYQIIWCFPKNIHNT